MPRSRSAGRGNLIFRLDRYWQFNGTYDDPSGAKQTLLITIRQSDDDHFVVNIRGADTNAPHDAVVETTYTRKK